MDDGWTDSTINLPPNPLGVNGDGGSSFSKGRGFAICNGNGVDTGGWGSNEIDTWGDNNNYGSIDKNTSNYEHGEEHNSRGKGRGSRGGRGGRGSYNGGGGNWGNTDNHDDRSRGRGRGGRGGRGRGGGRGEFGNGENDDNSWGGGWGGNEQSGSGRGGHSGRGGRGGGHGETEDGKPKVKDIYIPRDTEEDDLFNSGVTSGINFNKYEEISIKITGENYPSAITSFQEAGFRPLILENVTRSGYVKPTPIQKTSIPIIMSGRDLMSCAQTGSGKTAAFLLPIIHQLLENEIPLVVENNRVEPQAVIVSPTRELTIQIYDQATKFGLRSFLKIVKAYGGTSVNHQMKKLMGGCHILVATPGRMNDFVQKGWLSFASTRFIVLDEADRMLDMGFLPAITDMLEHPTMTKTGDRQTLMFSATFPEEIQHLAGKFLNDYIFVAVGIVGGACTDVQQVFHQVDKFDKRKKLLEILTEEGSERTLVFVETKRNTDFLATYLSENNLPTTSIHGDRLQREREDALEDFKRGRKHVLVATGVAARGLDINDVKHVINYDLPNSIDEYVHRIGRTGRLGNRGKATSFYDGDRDGAIAGALARILKQAEQEVPTWLGTGSGGAYYGSSGFGGTDVRGNNFGQAQDFTKNPVEEVEEEW